MTNQMPTFSVKDYIDAATLRRDMAFSDNDLHTAMNEQAALLAHYGTLQAQAQFQVDTVKLLLETAESGVYSKIRDDMDMRGEKVTEAMLEKMVMRHPKIIEMKKALNSAKRIAAMGKTAVEGFRHRRDMLIQKGLLFREELKGELRINAPAVRDQVNEDTKDRFLKRFEASSAENE